MKLGSHNSWSYLKPKHWWLAPFNFIAKCQDVDIYEQHEIYGVECFDLRVRFNKYGDVQLCHGFMTYKTNGIELGRNLSYINSIKGEVRVILDTRTFHQYNSSYPYFRQFCAALIYAYPDIKFWCGRNLYDWEVDYNFKYNPTCKEDYASVSDNKWINQFYPYPYAKKYNHKILSKKHKEDILLIDFVNIK